MDLGRFNNQDSPFQSFWMGGYECADHLNVHGNRVDFLEITKHAQFIDDDYRLLQQFEIKTVREGICWSLVEKIPYEYDFRLISKMMDAADLYDIQQVWDICHFGYPSDLTPLHPHFKNRFVRLCQALVEFYLARGRSRHRLIITPINEVSFISWLGGEVAATSPFCRGKGWDVKYELMGAYIAGVKLMKEIYPDVLILSTEPLVNIVAPHFAEEEMMYKAASDHQLQYQSNDILCGRICPELGGKEEYLDLLGLNYYYTNQYTCCDYEIIPWANEFEDSRWRPLSELISEAYHRYNRPVLLSETSHPGEDRSKWISFITHECAKTLESGIPLLGICIYPIVDRPDWDNTLIWHDSGLWGAVPDLNDESERPVDEFYAATIMSCKAEIEAVKNAMLIDTEGNRFDNSSRSSPFRKLFQTISDWKFF
ncbi:beta-glucosidase/6-phospho-beta-glucosidase/beta-galactosidase [Pedobacter sp. UYEF25]